MTASDYKELLNTFFEGLISLVTVLGAGWMISTNPNNSTVVGLASGVLLSVVTFWFSQRGQVKAVNGNIQALANIASQMLVSGKALTSTAPAPGVEVKN